MIVGNLYLVDVCMDHKIVDETSVSRFLMVAENEEELDSRFNCQFDVSDYKSVRITNVQKIKQKMHMLSTRIEPARVHGQVVKRAEGSKKVLQSNSMKDLSEYNPKIYAIGISTTIVAADQSHAMRKLGSYLTISNTLGGSKSNSPLSENSKILIEEVAKSSGFAMPRDVSNGAERAHMVRG